MGGPHIKDDRTLGSMTGVPFFRENCHIYVRVGLPNQRSAHSKGYTILGPTPIWNPLFEKLPVLLVTY